MLECHRTNAQKSFSPFSSRSTHQTLRIKLDVCFEISPQRHGKEAPQTLQRWKDTLRAVGDKSGWVFNCRDDQSELVEEVVQKTWIRLNIVPLIDVKHLVGFESRVESVLSILSSTSNTSSEDIQFLGICGQGGIGKTTIASIVYIGMSKNFSKSCFLENVREEASQSNGIACLQERFLYGISRVETKICSSREGSRLIKERLQNVKTLLMLDDVGDRTQLDALARDLNWFGSGSKILITTRDQSVLSGIPINI
ncbi:disease resistance protein L6-like [Telopea speciosissima]|uniref:disease resistance protein L6-like n=1 Tax=Telopea speciosissima TaxID=54955 RepID=UPI001CC552AD|nr:disease resistance protein L6-like [Telopea speciosissima]